MLTQLELAINLATSNVPLAKLDISNTPNGPFQTTVLAFLSMSSSSFKVLGPTSIPIQPAGIALESTVFILASLSNLSAITLSTGKYKVLFNSFAFSIISLAVAI